MSFAWEQPWQDSGGTAGGYPASERLWAYPGALAIGLAMAAYLFPLSFIAGDALIYQVGDFAQHVSGWFF